MSAAGIAAPWPARRVRSSFKVDREAAVNGPDAKPSVLAAQQASAVVPSPTADAAWVPPSWEDVVKEHGNRVYRLAYRLTGNAHDAEDLTQDVFVRVFRSLADYTPGTFEGWLHRITTNLFLDRMRRQQKIRFDALPEDTERLAGREASPEAVYAEAHLDADIEAALAALPPDFRAAVVLCDIEQLSYEEIAQTLGVKLGTVRSRISRGRAMLRAALADRAPRESRLGVALPTQALTAEIGAVPPASAAPADVVPPASSLPPAEAALSREGGTRPRGRRRRATAGVVGVEIGAAREGRA
ncbi:RNA polymerase sigma factor SigE [Pseudofrankia sp. BMG5.37]|uniref:RNA polymerase sigma factor SigE n=1 Tax=Pseudofrankia sp. BMG5.36 TaxID=1834512 RepID=UPI001F51F470|nr:MULTISPECIES: RNA polymerase sigma factor SigE [unclassified Pseudofrankia]MDT3441226.1 RNA polymerase sigma factor SigE [Pseudofrankia sp. BMG5.37]